MSVDAVKNFAGRSQQERIVDFLNEVGMLRHTPRTGYQFLGSGQENVAEHSFRTAVIGHVLARLAGIAPERVVFLCLFHDLHEARTGDFNYVNHMYNHAESRVALTHATAGTGLEDEVLNGFQELQDSVSIESRLAHDADQLDFILNLKAESDKGNAFALDWLENACKRLVTEEGRSLASVIMQTDHNLWWYAGADRSWWEKHR